MKGRACIVCGRAIKKQIQGRMIRTEEQAARGILAGSADVGHVITLPRLPATIEEVRRLTNAPHITKVYYAPGGTSAAGINAFNTWDGESYVDLYFCTNRCAIDQGYASAKHGDRFTWRRGQ